MRRISWFPHGWVELLLTLIVVAALLVGLGVQSAEGTQGGGTPNVVPPDPGLSSLLSVDSSAGVDWAVGYSQANLATRQTLIMRYRT